jgi:hypothetical protein
MHHRQCCADNAIIVLVLFSLVVFIAVDVIATHRRYMITKHSIGGAYRDRVGGN